MLSTLIAILVHYEVIPETEAKHLVDKLDKSIHPTQYRDAKALVAKILDELK
jgi:hypothetical protein